MRYQVRPILGVDAIQYTEENRDECLAFDDRVIWEPKPWFDDPELFLLLRTQVGTVEVPPTYFIVRHFNNTLESWSADNFLAIYQPLDSPT